METKLKHGDVLIKKNGTLIGIVSSINGFTNHVAICDNDYDATPPGYHLENNWGKEGCFICPRTISGQGYKIINIKDMTLFDLIEYGISWSR